MSEPAPSAEVGRLVACRACGNRVSRTARRCPGCGAQDPASDQPIEPRARHRHRAASSRQPRRLAPLVVVAAAVVLAVLIAVIAVRVSSRRAERAPAATLPPPAVTETPAAPEPPATVAAPVTVAPEPPPKEPSRSRGKRDWPFFFKAGDRLARMGDAKPLGYITRTVKDHKFDDGTLGPAYVLWTPAGDEQAFDADELERGAKLE